LLDAESSPDAPLLERLRAIEGVLSARIVRAAD
jgi:hypothetical protein